MARQDGVEHAFRQEQVAAQIACGIEPDALVRRSDPDGPLAVGFTEPGR